MAASACQELSSRSCVVKLNFKNSKSEECSACGTVLHPTEGLVLSHGSLLTDYVTANKDLLKKVLSGNIIKKSDLPGAVFSLLLSNQTLPSKLCRDIRTQKSLIADRASSSNLTKQNNLSADFTSARCQFLAAFRNNDFHKSVNKLMPSSSWTFNSDLSADNKDDNNAVSNKKKEIDSSYATFHLLSYFIILKVSSNVDDLPHGGYLINSQLAPLMIRNNCCIGDTAEIISTPFANMCPSVFYNAYSRGVISNVSGENNCWIITDARCIPGSEGGPLFTKTESTGAGSYLTGIIASSLCWKNNEWIGFSVACGIDSILNSMANHKELFIPKADMTILPPSRLSQSLSVNMNVAGQVQLSAVTALVQCGSSWGTCVIVDRDHGIILTCSHVIKEAGGNPVRVKPSESKQSWPAEVIYRQDPLTVPYDIAVVKCLPATQHLPKGWSITVSQGFVGEKVILSGHSVFSTDHDLQPSVCHGVVSKVIKRRDKAVLMQTTCAVHAGVSGGPLVSASGHLIGLAVCNIRDTGNSSSFPHVNLCIPACVVWPHIRQYILHGDEESLSRLHVDDLELKRLWALGSNAYEDSVSPLPKSRL